MKERRLNQPYDGSKDHMGEMFAIPQFASFPFHPVADAFPMMDEKQLEELTQDIKENGQRDYILVYQGKVIDGRNRYRACQKLRVTPVFKFLKKIPGSLVSFVVSKNLYRRHLTTAQRAEVALKLEPFYQEEAESREKAGKKVDPETSPKGRARALAAQACQVARQTVDDVARVHKYGIPALVEALRAGRVKAYKAAKIARLTEEEQREYTEQTEFLENVAIQQGVSHEAIEKQIQATEVLRPVIDYCLSAELGLTPLWKIVRSLYKEARKERNQEKRKGSCLK